MKDYRHFLNENLILNESKAFNIAIDSEEDVDKYNLKPENELVKAVLAVTKGYVGNKIPLAVNSQGQVKIRAKDYKSEIDKWFKDNGYSKDGFAYGNGSIGQDGKSISPTTQELMVASLVLLGKTYPDKLSIEDANELIENAKSKFPNIIGISGKGNLLEQYDQNYNDLATAISSSNSILELVTPVNVFFTGQSWDKRIAKFNPPVNNIKDYNSSDIVVEGNDGIFYGFSLKKKGRSKDVDPTLINKPITGKKSLLKDLLSSDFVEQVEIQKDLFFDNTIKKHYKLSDLELSKKTDKEKTTYIREIGQKGMGKYLKSRDNNFFKYIGDNLPIYTDDFTKEFLSLLFRTNLSKLVDASEFVFYLSTGIGRFDGEQLTIEKSETKDLDSVIEVLTNIFNSDLKMIKTRGKKNAWEDGTSAAKVFFTITSDNVPIINIEIRYKGSYTANPQFQAVATPNFKNLFK